ncbi:histidine--tRNA ligase [Fructilactobacillus lindneri]|uniref:Histidine--tRNA ligase n=3 Tax=Fructilactobacillus lindneri TaxID=53444 RepID=A0A0R2JXL0_9LACO|nr:histidine--tRNA ligase [Fructilactobacillus lindneri]ANZ57733.1 histidine--tRNA ligase [Fructilactobacillus lindneri]ANZ59002.1 histidine--tRNA ligase [Fructilactobacillus lindneri]KRN78829.1 histidyl-tRNA synthetase [Fructilactobacillus lindneri DSM 20690 = JCM 11027]POG98028.1 histidine--tRNA ligase [Fructilactobacillus lindneri]POG99074.1 histidine--tRNA ligase [Fructilactobacillus lindneri]
MDEKFKSVRGMEDILPGTTSVWQRIEGTAREVFARYNYAEMRTPMVEKTDVFSRTSGDSSDIVTKQMYTFEDKGDRSITLRPEGTAGIVRSFVENKLFGPEHPKPVKVYYMGPMFRYERPGATHNRQFYQIGCESIGAVSPQIDAEVIKLALDIFHGLDIDDLRVELNTLGDDESRNAYRETLVEYFAQFKDELSSDSQRRLEQNPLRILDSKDRGDQKIVANAPKLEDSLNDRSKKYFHDLLQALDILGVDYVIDDRLVRGLDYYTDTVFEIQAKAPEFGDDYTTICAGGRYNNMVQEFGGPEMGGVGFAFGEDRLATVVQSEETEDVLDYFICTDTKGKSEDEINTIFDQALKKAEELRDQGNSVEVNFQPRSMKSQKKEAFKLNSQNTIVIE